MFNTLLKINWIYSNVKSFEIIIDEKNKTIHLLSSACSSFACELTACSHVTAVLLTTASSHVPIIIGITIAMTNNHIIFALIWYYFQTNQKWMYIYE